MPVNFKVLDVRRIPSAEPGRVGRFDWLVTYELDPLHVQMVTVPQDSLTEQAIADAVRKDLEAIARFVGKSMQVPGS